MRKGFLLAADGKTREDKQQKRHIETTPLTNDADGLSMKRGFLLPSSTTATTRRRRDKNKNNIRDEDATKTTPLPQCRLDNSQIDTVASTALLELEESTHKTDATLPHNDSIVSSSLVNFIASSFESTRNRGDQDEDLSDCKQQQLQQPIIEDTDNRPITIIAEKIMDSEGSVDSANDRNTCIEEFNPVDAACSEVDSFAFANEVSQLLSKLRRMLKSNKQSKRVDEENDSSLGVRQVMNEKTEQLVKVFVEKHIIQLDSSVEKKMCLRHLWPLLLEHIAQESTTFTLKKRRRKKNPTSLISPQLALGIGVLEFSHPTEVALESLADVLSELVASIVQRGASEEKQKQRKTEAIGAILLLRCHFRCLCIETTKEQKIDIETTILLKQVIPALQSIVVNEQKRTILTAAAADAFFEMVELFPRVCVQYESSGSHAFTTTPVSIWKDILPRIEEMIDVTRCWTTKDKGGGSGKIQATPILFCNLPCQAILPPIIEYLSQTHTTSTIQSGSTSISYLLCNLMEESSKEHADDFVRCLISSSQRLESDKLIFERNGEIWKSFLLESCVTFAYRNILLATAKSMVDMPSSTIPLTLFSCLVGTTHGLEAEDSERKILVATISVVRFAVNQLRLSYEFDIDDEGAVFKRISPLLILRRLPKAYYQILHKHIISDTENTRTVMCELAAGLANSFTTLSLKNDEGKVAKEEKVLVAQVAGYCLPFSVTPDGDNFPISLFDICEKPFSISLEVMRTNSKSSLCLQSIRESKLALFAVCQHIPGANNEDVSGDALIKVAKFALECLLHHQSTCGDEIVKLHTGCLHFFSVVFDSLFARKAKFFEEPQTTAEENNCRQSFFDGLIMTFNMTTSILFSGAVEGTHEQRFSPSTQTSIFNSMVIYCQNCTTEDQRLALFASEILPPLLKWVDQGTIGADAHHPLCVAASLQVVYTIFARLGSFDWVTNFCKESESTFLRLTFCCATRSLCNSEERGVVISPLRLAAMKVILTAIATKQDLSKYLETVEIRRALAAICRVANEDPSQEVRGLAIEILPHLEHMIAS